MARLVKLRTILAVLGVSAMPVSVLAQAEAPRDEGALEEIVVTASKRGAVRLQDIPVSATVFDGDFFSETGQVNFLDYFAQVPGLSMNNKGPGDKLVIIRGVNSNGAGTVSLYFDEVIMTAKGEGDFGRAPDIKTFDLERLEVLKGPQGTTFGSSSLSGTIRYIPVQPKFNVFEAEVGGASSVKRFSRELGWRAQGMINVPVSENIAVRVAALTEKDQGYIDNRFADDIGDDRVDAIRGMFRWRATDDLEISAFGMVQERYVQDRNFFNERNASLSLSDTLNGQPIGDTEDDFEQAVLARGKIVSDIEMYNLKGVYNPGWGTFTATTSLFDRFTNVERPVSFASEVLFGIPADDGGQSFIARDRDQENWHSEIRFASNWDRRYQVLIGGFYSDQEFDEFSPFVFNLDPATGRQVPESKLGRQENIVDDVEEVAIFGEVEFSLTEKLKLTGGFRWFDIDVITNSASIVQFLARPGAGPDAPRDFSEKDVIFKAGLSYNVTPDAMTYFLFSEGFRPGGGNDESPEDIPGINVDIPPGFGSDGLDNFELGFKTSWFDGRLTVNGAAYLVDWTDIQAEQQVESEGGLQFAVRSNGGAAEIKGFELGLAAAPIQGLTVSAGFNFNDAELTEDFPVPSDGQDGDEIPHTPEFTSFADVKYEKPLMIDNVIGFVGLNWTYRDSTSNRFRPTDPFERTIESHSIVDLRAGVEKDNWEVVLRVDNVLDADDIVSYTFDFQFPAAALPEGEFLPDNKVRVQPRTVELAFRYWL